MGAVKQKAITSGGSSNAMARKGKGAATIVIPISATRSAMNATVPHRERDPKLPGQKGAHRAQACSCRAPALEPQPDGEHVTQHDDVPRRQPPAHRQFQPAGDGNRKQALAHVRQQRDVSPKPARARADGVGGAHIAVARAAQVAAGARIED